MAASMTLLLFPGILVLFNVISANVRTDVCGLPNYDTRNLTMSQWQVNITNGSLCLPPTKQGCVVKFVFCSPLQEKGNCLNASVCQKNKNITTKLASYDTQLPFRALQDGRVGFQSVFNPGSKFNNSGKICTIQTTLTFLCNLNTHWPFVGSKTQNVPVKTNISKATVLSVCRYDLTFFYSGACVSLSPGNEIKQLSAGTVLVIIFFVFSISYFVFGCAWNMACKGARGLEAVPNYSFWVDLPVLVADGCLFVCRCGRLDSTGTAYESI